MRAMILSMDRKTPLHLIAEKGHLKACKVLLSHPKLQQQLKYIVTAKDKLKRTPLTLAVKNGHFHVARELLLAGAPTETPDTSSNYPSHYAAAYG